MHRIDGDNFAPGNLFTEGTPGVTPATEVTDSWLNDVQENICQFIVNAGGTLTKGSGTDLQDALIVKFVRHTDAEAVKSWGKVVTNGAGGVTIAGQNVFSATVDANHITVNFTHSMVDANYVVNPSVTIASGSTANQSAGCHSHATGSFKISVFDTSNARVNPSTSVVEVRFSVFGTLS